MMIKFAFDWPIATFKENYRVYVYELVVLMARKKVVCAGVGMLYVWVDVCGQSEIRLYVLEQPDLD